MTTTTSNPPASAGPAALLRDIKDGRRERPRGALDLQGANLAGMDLSDMDLSGANLSGADLSEANLAGARMFKANLVGASLRGANLSGAELSGADLTDAHLEEVNAAGGGFGMAQLERARFFHANLEHATLSKANLTDADLRVTNLRGARIREAVLHNADLTESDLQAADISLCDVGGAIFNDANLNEASLRMLKGFERAEWFGVDTHSVNFAGAYRVRRHIIDENYLREFRESSRWNRVLYYLWWSSSDCGRSIFRWCTWIFVVAYLFGCVFTFVGVDYGRHQTLISPFYYSVVTLTTLGYGDIIPKTPFGQSVAMLEVIIGYIMLGGLLSILSNKIARRGD